MKRVLAALALASLAPGCTTFYSARFVPAPLEARLDGPNAPDDLGRALISVRGIRRPDRGEPAKVELRLRLENLGTSALRLEREGLELVAADLEGFGACEVEPEAGTPVLPETSATYELRFPLQPGKPVSEYDFSGLNLRWAVRFDDRRLVTGVSFQRYQPPRDVYVYDAYPYPYWHFGFRSRVGKFCED